MNSSMERAGGQQWAAGSNRERSAAKRQKAGGADARNRHGGTRRARSSGRGTKVGSGLQAGRRVVWHGQFSSGLGRARHQRRFGSAWCAGGPFVYGAVLRCWERLRVRGSRVQVICRHQQL